MDSNSALVILSGVDCFVATSPFCASWNAFIALFASSREVEASEEASESSVAASARGFQLSAV